MDAAALSLTVKSGSVVQAANDLDRFSASATKAATASGLGGGSIARLVGTVTSMNSKLGAIVNGLDKVNSALASNARAAQGAAAANDNVARSLGVADSHVIAYTQHLASLARTQQDANAHVLAWRNNVAGSAAPQVQMNAHVDAYRKHLASLPAELDKTSNAIKFTAREGLNASRQFADIGVTAAMGMSPFLIAIQQGPQLFDILQEKAIATGTSISVVFRAAAASVLAMAAPLLPLIALLAVGAAGIAALTKQANDDSGLKKYTTSMGYTKEEVKKLNAVTVTWGDTTKAVFQGALAGAASSLGLNTKDMAKTWDSFLDHLATGTRATLAGIYAGIAGTKAYLGELEKGGVVGIGKMLIGQGDPGLLKNTYGKAYADGQKGLDAIVEQARKNALSRQNQMAKGFYDKPTEKTPKQDPWKNILEQGQNAIATEAARGRALGMSAEAAATMEQRQSLLNAANSAGIKLTDKQRATIDDLAASYAKLKIEADRGLVIQSVIDDATRQTDAINDQLTLVGQYGDALSRARIEMELLARARDSLPRGEVLSEDDYKRIASEADKGGRDQANLDRATRGERLRKDAEDAAYAMDLERNGLALTGAAAIQYAFVVDRLNEAKRAGIALSPAEVAAIQAAGKAYGDQRYAIDQQAQSIADAREVTKGFFSDWINGAREGGNALKSFADAAVNSLNRIIDKLLDKSLDGFLNSAFGVRATSSVPTAGPTRNAVPNALGGVYGSPHRFANGGAFTNSIVTSPTLFRFANGGALGEMGEAGPEAIMPLKRGPNGSLGVQMHGGGRPVIRMGDYNPSYSFAGAVGLDGIASMVREGGAATYDQIKRDLQSLLQQLDTDGAFSS